MRKVKPLDFILDSFRFGGFSLSWVFFAATFLTLQRPLILNKPLILESPVDGIALFLIFSVSAWVDTMVEISKKTSFPIPYIRMLNIIEYVLGACALFFCICYGILNHMQVEIVFSCVAIIGSSLWFFIKFYRMLKGLQAFWKSYIGEK
jgi:hypothetical protein